MKARESRGLPGKAAGTSAFRVRLSSLGRDLTRRCDRIPRAHGATVRIARHDVRVRRIRRHDPNAAVGNAHDYRLDLRFARADSLLRAGAFAAARELYEAIASGSRDGAIRATAAARLARLCVDEERFAGVPLWLARGRAWLTGDASADAAVALAQLDLAEIELAFKSNLPERVAECAETALQSLAPFSTSGDPEVAAVRVRLLLHAAAANVYLGDVARAETLHAEAEMGARDAADLPVADRIQLWSARALFEGLRIEGLARAQEANHRSLALAAQNGFSDSAWIAAHNLAKFSFGAGVSVEASGYGRDAAAFARINEPVGLGAARHRAHVTAFAHASSGRLDAALAGFLALRRMASGDELTRAGIFLYESRALVRGARFAAAAASSEEAAGIFARAGRTSSYGAALSLRGEALLRLGDRRGAARAIADASAVLGRSCLNVTHLATVLRCRHALTGRRSYLTDARDIERALRAAASEPASRRRGPDATARLTARQREIATLLSSGATRRDIGARLGISERTVAHHTEAIYERLGIRARWQLAAKLDG